MFILLLQGAVISVSAVPQSDLPETSYNEVDTPINQAPPVVPGVRIVRPAAAPVILPRPVREGVRTVGAQAHDWNSTTDVRSAPHSLQDLLCTFLI
jgi:hypothetical protein